MEHDEFIQVWSTRPERARAMFGFEPDGSDSVTVVLQAAPATPRELKRYHPSAKLYGVRHLFPRELEAVLAEAKAAGDLTLVRLAKTAIGIHLSGKDWGPVGTRADAIRAARIEVSQMIAVARERIARDAGGWS